MINPITRSLAPTSSVQFFSYSTSSWRVNIQMDSVKLLLIYLMPSLTCKRCVCDLHYIIYKCHESCASPFARGQPPNARTWWRPSNSRRPPTRQASHARRCKWTLSTTRKSPPNNGRAPAFHVPTLAASIAPDVLTSPCVFALNSVKFSVFNTDCASKLHGI